MSRFLVISEGWCVTGLESEVIWMQCQVSKSAQTIHLCASFESARLPICHSGAWMNQNLRHLSVHDKSSGAKLINQSLQLLLFPARSLTTSADTSPSPHGAFAFVSRAPRGEGVTRVVNISHSHLHDTIDHACHLGSCLVLERRLAPQLFHICSCGSFDAAGRPWESRVTATAHTSHLLWILSWSPRSLRGR